MKKETYYYQNNNYKIIKISETEFYEIIHNNSTLSLFLNENICIGNNYGKNFYEISTNDKKYILRKYINEHSDEIVFNDHATLQSTIKQLIDKIRIEPRKNYIDNILKVIRYLVVIIALSLVILVIMLIFMGLNVPIKILLTLTSILLILEIIESIITKNISLRAMKASYEDNPVGYFGIMLMHLVIVGIIIVGIFKV